jgi:phage terminase large subunit-like protein
LKIAGLNDDLKSMSRAEKIELIHQAGLLAEELQRRHVEEKLRFYRPHPKQEEFHRCLKRNRWLFGGNRTGKTVGGAAEAAWWARGNHPYRKILRPTSGWIVSLTNEVQRDVAQREFLSLINPAWIKGVKMREGKADDLEHGVIDYILIESIHGGVSQVGFKSCDQGRERFQGTSRDWIWFDEEPPEEIYLECLMRVMDCRGSIWGTMTPLKGLTWVYMAIWINEKNNPEVWSSAMAWEDNPYLSPEEIEQLMATLSDSELESRREGKFVAMTGLVYSEFREDVHVIEPFPVPAEWMDRISIDPGIDKPLSCHWYAVNQDGDVFVVGEWYKAGWHVSAHMREIERISRELGWKRDSRGWLSCIMDAAANQRTVVNEETVASVFRDHHMNVNTNVNKSKFAGIERVKEYLHVRKAEHFGEVDAKKWPKGKPKLFIFNTCKEMIKEIKQYRWGDNDEPIKDKDHAMDELRYFIMTKPQPRKPAQERFENEIGRDKRVKAERLHRRQRFGIGV